MSEQEMLDAYREWILGANVHSLPEAWRNAWGKAYEAGRKSVLDSLKCQYEGDGLLIGGAE